MNRDTAVPYILAESFMDWWRGMNQPDLRPAFLYWADQQGLSPRRKHSVWSKVRELRGTRRAA